jgi:hypothetical protein
MKTTKPRSDSKLHGLTAEQRAKLDGWLFGENRSIREVTKLCWAEFCCKVGRSSVARYHEREKLKWGLRNAMQKLPGNGPDGECAGLSEAEFRGLLRLAAGMARECAGGELEAEKRRTFIDCMKLLIASRREGHEALRATTTREKFEFDAATACLLNQIEVQSVMKDESLDDGQRILAIRQQLFGQNLPE